MSETVEEVHGMELDTLVPTMETITQMKALWHQLDALERQLPPLTASQERLMPSH